jgi:TPR repeat protein
MTMLARQLQIQESHEYPPSVKDLLDKAKHMSGVEKQDMANKYYLQAQRYEARKDVPSGDSSDLFALHYYDASSRLGNLDAKNKLGVFHSKGRGGLPIDEEKALKEFKAAAKAGHARAKRNMATYFARGRADQCQDGSTAYLLLSEVSKVGRLIPDSIAGSGAPPCGNACGARVHDDQVRRAAASTCVLMRHDGGAGCRRRVSHTSRTRGP